MFNKKYKNCNGFTLVELMVVLIISGILFGTLASIATQYFREKKEIERDLAFKEIRSSLASYAADDLNDPDDEIRFPCPAPLTAAPNTAEYGNEICPVDVDGDGHYENNVAVGDDLGGVYVLQGKNGKVLVGAVPTKELDIPSVYMLDSYKNKILYAVSLNHVDEDALLDPPIGDIVVQEEDGGLITDKQSFFIVSHGSDEAGSFSYYGVPTTRCRNAGEGDARNCQWQMDDQAIFVSSSSFSLGKNDGYYDDTTLFTIQAEEDDEGWWRETSLGSGDITHKNEGNVGIGTDAPQRKLHVAFSNDISDGTNNQLLIENTNTDSLSAHSALGIKVAHPDAGSYLHFLSESYSTIFDTRKKGAFGFDHGAQQFKFWTSKAPGDWTAKIFINKEGDLGLGTSAPESKIDVNGEIKLGNSGVACSADNEGAQRYNKILKNMEFCDAIAWRAIGAAGSIEYYDCFVSKQVSNAQGWMCSRGSRDGEKDKGEFPKDYPTHDDPGQYVVRDLRTNGDDWGGSDKIECCKVRVISGAAE